MPIQALMATGDEALARRFSSAVAEIGLQVECVTETGTALNLLAARRYEALLLDCDLEGSLDLLELVRNNPLNGSTLVLASASAQHVAREAGRLGANFVLQKPINWEMAKRTLRVAQAMIIRERRQQIRQKVQFPATLKIGQKVLQTHLVDMSGTGVAIKTSASMPIGKQAQIDFQLPNSRNSINSTCKVVWVKDGVVGLQFLYLSPASAEAILSWLSRHSPRSRAANL